MNVLEQARVVRQIVHLGRPGAAARWPRSGRRCASKVHAVAHGQEFAGIQHGPSGASSRTRPISGRARYGKTWVGPRRSRPRPQRNSAEQPRRGLTRWHTRARTVASRSTCRHWWTKPSSALVAEQLGREPPFAPASGVCAEPRYLLQGLLVCKHCGYGLYGKPGEPGRGQGEEAAVRLLPLRRHGRLPLRRRAGLLEQRHTAPDVLEEVVWKDACALLGEIRRKRAREYERRLKGKSGGRGTRRGESRTKLVQESQACA